MSPDSRLITTIAAMLLERETAQAELTRLVWENMTSEQKTALSDAAYKVAMDRVELVVHRSVHAVGKEGFDFPKPMFARHIEQAIHRAIESENLSKTIRALVTEQLAVVQASLPETVRETVNSITKGLLANVLTNMDGADIGMAFRTAVRDTFSKKG